MYRTIAVTCGVLTVLTVVLFGVYADTEQQYHSQMLTPDDGTYTDLIFAALALWMVAFVTIAFGALILHRKRCRGQLLSVPETFFISLSLGSCLLTAVTLTLIVFGFDCSGYREQCFPPAPLYLLSLSYTVILLLIGLGCVGYGLFRGCCSSPSDDSPFPHSNV